TIAAWTSGTRRHRCRPPASGRCAKRCTQGPAGAGKTTRGSSTASRGNWGWGVTQTGPEILQLARQRLDQRDPAGARQLLEAGVRANPSDLDMLLLLAVTCRMQRDHRAALAALDGAIKAHPYAFMAHLSRGAVLEDLGQEAQ